MGKKKQWNKDKTKFLYPSRIEQHAFHLAGHAIMYLALGMDFKYVTIESSKTDGMSYEKDGIRYQSAAQIVFKKPKLIGRREIILTSLAGPFAEDIRCHRKIDWKSKPENAEDYSLAFSAAKGDFPDEAKVCKFMDRLADETVDILMKHRKAVVDLAVAIVRYRTVTYEAARLIFSQPAP